MFPTYCSHSRGTPNFLPQLNLTPSPLLIYMRVDSPALSGKGSRPSHRTSRGVRSHIGTREEALWVMPHSEKHHYPRSLKISPDAQAPLECNPEDEVTTRSGTDTPVASSGKSRRFQIQLDKWPFTPCTTREVSGVPFLNTTRGLTLLSNSAETLRYKSEMERNPEVPTSTRDEALFIPAVMREESEVPFTTPKEI